VDHYRGLSAIRLAPAIVERRLVSLCPPSRGEVGHHTLGNAEPTTAVGHGGARRQRLDRICDKHVERFSRDSVAAIAIADGALEVTGELADRLR
jgi:hypothetical protein